MHCRDVFLAESGVVLIDSTRLLLDEVMKLESKEARIWLAGLPEKRETSIVKRLSV